MLCALNIVVLLLLLLLLLLLSQQQWTMSSLNLTIKYGKDFIVIPLENSIKPVLGINNGSYWISTLQHFRNCVWFALDCDAAISFLLFVPFPTPSSCVLQVSHPPFTTHPPHTLFLYHCIKKFLLVFRNKQAWTKWYSTSDTHYHWNLSNINYTLVTFHVKPRTTSSTL